MGIKGAAGYLSSSGCVVAYSSADRRKASLDPIFRPHHLVLDMNCILHTSFETKHPDFISWIEGVKRSLVRLFTVFAPQKTVLVVFDGVAPTAKLMQQRQRRHHLPPCKEDLNEDFESKKITLAHEEITAGSPFLIACEQALVEWLPLTISEKYSQVKCFWSGCREPGEGEIKISSFLHKYVEEGIADESDTFSIVGNDSDLVFVSLVATPFHNLFVVHPESLDVTHVNLLIKYWSKLSPSPDRPLYPHLLKSYRIDFTFIMLLAGCDYFAGVGTYTKAIWGTYRHLRQDGGYFRKPLIAGSDFVVDVGFLRELLLKSGKKTGKSNNPRNRRPPKTDPDAGEEVLRGAMWALQTMVQGCCVNPMFVSGVPQENNNSVSIQSLVQASQRKNIAERIADVNRKPEWATQLYDNKVQENGYMLSLLEQYVCVMGARGRYSPALKNAFGQLEDRGGTLQNGGSIKRLIESVKKLFKNVDSQCLYPFEVKIAEPQSAPTPPGKNRFMLFFP